MAETPKPTEFASPGRSDGEQMDRQVYLISQVPLLSSYFDAIPLLVLILNEHRQIVYANRATVAAFGMPNREALYGLRPGEALNCIRASESHAGCGTTSFCRECGAVRSILAGFEGGGAVEECRITPKGGANPFNFGVTSTRYVVENERFVVCTIADISHEKQREVLERIFFHDVNNTLTVIKACLDLMPLHSTARENELAEKIAAGINMLINEIGTQQGLLEAEDGNLSLEFCELHSLELLREIELMYQCYDYTLTKSIQVDEAAIDVAFSSDKIQLTRIIGNMVKNALEASSSGDQVRVGCNQGQDGQICIWVQNSQYMPPDVQAQIFNRSFSTKGIGRGVGTYSMKLFGERYLKGKVSFTSSPENGTTFSIFLPTTPCDSGGGNKR